MANHFKYVIVGGGRAGASAAEGIREHDRSASIALFCKEHHLPYDRPPLSKGLWLGKAALKDLPVHDEGFYKKQKIHLHLGLEIVSIDRQKKQVTDSEGTHYGYEKLLLATGGSPRALSFGGDAVQYYRTVDDYQRLKDTADGKNEFILIGGGFIGGELAAALKLNGKKVTMIFPDEYLLKKVLPPDLAKFVTEYYQSKGVVVLSEDVATSVERAGGVTTVKTKSGKVLTGDAVIAAIGLNLHIEMAMHAGLKVEHGVSVNNLLQTSDPNIYAAGDIASFPAKSLDKTIRVEHWNNAQEQGTYAGENMAGARKPYDYLPYFYSDLFDLGFEAVGELDSHMKTFADWHEQFREGVIYYLDDGLVKGVLLWNVWEKVNAARALIDRKRKIPDPRKLAGML